MPGIVRIASIRPRLVNMDRCRKTAGGRANGLDQIYMATVATPFSAGCVNFENAKAGLLTRYRHGAFPAEASGKECRDMNM